MHKSIKTKLLTFLPFVVLYFLFNYLPIEHWVGGNEIIYLSIKLGVYGLSAAALIYLKHKFHVEIEVPEKQISIWWLIPLLFVCFTHPLYATLFGDGVKLAEEIEFGVLAFDAGVDIFVSIVEDILFVDLYISLLMEVFKKHKYKRVLSIFVAAITFTVAHAYTFIYHEPLEAVVILVTVFFLIVECGYLAIYFDSALIPIIAHALFNELNFVIFDQIYDVTYSDYRYATFAALMILMAGCYLSTLYRMSTLQKYRPNFHEEVDE
ncbi:MAG: CPBP family glutamic-type intramembrane protease [Bacilli bacterium]|nr:CPBP family glutamic-type intramembrane protease [Bacilli bacterium]